jgi:hypothetical protein
MKRKRDAYEKKDTRRYKDESNKSKTSKELSKMRTL